MEEIIDHESDAPVAKIYKVNQIIAATFFSGPLTGGYMMAQNFKAFGQDSKYRNTMILTIIGTILFFGTIIFLPTSINIPPILFSIGNLAIVYSALNHYQRTDIEDYINSGGSAHGGSRVVGLSIIGFLICTLLVAAGMIVIDINEKFTYLKDLK